MHPTSMHNDSGGGDNVVQKNSDANNDSDEGDNVPHENNVQVAAQGIEDDVEWV